MQDITKVKSRSRGAMCRWPAGRIVNAHEAVRMRLLRILEDMVHVPLVTEEITDDAYGERESFAPWVIANFQREAAPGLFQIGEGNASRGCDS
jgi:hypothetical protein